MRAVSTRDRTVAELRTYLERKRVEPAAIDAAVAELTAAGLLDDAAYARRFAEDKRELQRWGSERIERDLRKRGIAPELIESVLGATERSAELDSARRACCGSVSALRATTASATAPGDCSSAAATSTSWPTKPYASSSAALRPESGLRRGGVLLAPTRWRVYPA